MWLLVIFYWRQRYLTSDEEWIFLDFGKGKLHWENDLEMLSHFLDRKVCVCHVIYYI